MIYCKVIKSLTQEDLEHQANEFLASLSRMDELMFQSLVVCDSAHRPCYTMTFTYRRKV